MKKAFYYAFVALIVLSVGGCGGKHDDGTKAKKAYNPKHIAGATAEDGAIVKVAGDLYIWKVDDVSLVGKFKRFWRKSGGPNLVYVKEGRHTIYIDKAKRNYPNAAIRNFNFIKKHQYLITYTETSDGRYYTLKLQVKDLTENKILSEKSG